MIAGGGCDVFVAKTFASRTRRCPIGTYKRLPRGKQKSHDEFLDWTTQAILWVRENWQVAIELTIVAAVAFAVIVGANSYWQHRSQGAADALYEAMRLAPGSEDQAKKLEAVAGDYSRTPAGRQAMMALGNLLLERKEYDRAIDVFRRLAGRSRNHAILMVAALHRLAEAQLAKGDARDAAETYLKAAADPSNLIARESRLRAAAALEHGGEQERAAQLYRQIMQDAGDQDRAVRDRAEERVLWLVTQQQVGG